MKETAKDNNGSSSASEGEFSQDIICEEPPKKRFHHLNRILEAKWKEGLKRTATLPPGKAEIEKYFLTVDAAADKVDPIVYWTGQQHNYPLLSSIALDILAIPATSAPVEQVFSTAGESTAGKRNRLSDKNLEREVLLRRNRHFL